MKKLIPIVMTVCLLSALAACGKQETAVAIVTPEPITTQTTEQQPEQAAVSVPTVAPVTAAEQTEQSGDSDSAGQVSRGNDSGTATTTTTNTNSGNSGNSNSGDAYTVAQGYVGSSLSSLIAAVGSPSSQEYTLSCVEDASQEGMLYYDGFMVWTIQYNDGTEIVKGVSQT